MGSGVSMIQWSEERKTRYLLFSIKPKFVTRILEGRKYYEFRKKFPLHADRFVFYATSPVKKIVAIAERTHLLIGDLEYLWEETKEVAGISREEFEGYYAGSTHGVAVGLTEVKKMLCDMNLSEIGIKQAPQMYMYLDEEQWQRVYGNVCKVEWRS